MQKQLVRLSILCAGKPVCPNLPVFRKPLDAFTLPPGPATWGVVYEAPLHLGWDGNRIVVESFVVDLQGKAHPVGRGGYEMNGFALNAFQVPNLSQDSLSVLVWGMKLWSSGHALPGKVTLYSLGPNGVSTVWQTPVLHSVEAAPVPLGPDAFMIQYHDEDRCTHRLPDRAVDTYRVSEGGLKRMAHQYW